MNQMRAFTTTATAALIVGLVAVFALQRPRVGRVAGAADVSSVALTRNDAEIRDRDIEFYSRRVEEDSAGALDREMLAELMFARARYTGSADDFVRAERLARKSVTLRPERNGQAFELLASVLMARHAFKEAHTVMLRADSLSPGNPSHLALLGEIELEMGEYDAAATRFRAIRLEGEHFTIAARIARWYELTGHSDVARTLLVRSINRVRVRDDLPREQAAWFSYRLGELELRVGHVAAADSAFQAALRINPEDIRALGGLTRLEIIRRQWQRALDHGARATAVQFDPATIGAMSVAYSALGDSAQAASFAEAMSINARGEPSGIHRAWGLFLLDHGTAADHKRVLGLARAGVRDRRDVYAYDLLAWALFRVGKIDEARTEMSRALAQNTEDIVLREHARAMGAVSPLRVATTPRSR